MATKTKTARKVGEVVEGTQSEVLALEPVDLAPLRHEADEVGVAAQDDHKHLRVLRLETQAQVDAVGEVLLEVKRRANALDARRKDLVSPFNAATKRINDLFREPLRWLEACEGECKRALAEFAVAERARTAALLAEASRASAADQSARPVLSGVRLDATRSPTGMRAPESHCRGSSPSSLLRGVWHSPQWVSACTI